MNGEDVLHSRRHLQAEEGRPGQRQLPEAVFLKRNISLLEFFNYKGQFGEEKQEEEQLH